MTWVLREERQTQGAERLVMLALANHADPDRWDCWPSVKTLAHMANLTESYVRKTLARLEQKGLIERVVNGAPDQRIPTERRPNLYRLNAGGGAHSVRTPPTQSVPEPLRKDRAYPYAQSAYQNVNEPSLNRAGVPAVDVERCGECGQPAPRHAVFCSTLGAARSQVLS